ncbi:MAG: ABC transporter permease [Sphingobacteriales bacterium]|nr:MAG: ABC transporter permease [Sphingobacteriales bacterium]
MHETHSKEQVWTEIIRPQTGLLDINLSEVWRYRDLLSLLVRRDFIATYKQTILGPIWFFLQPLLTTVMFVVVFGRIAQISTDGLPMLLFYLSGITVWNYFSECLNKTATVFKDNASIFGKVYFPRLIMPLSIVASNLVKFGIQFALFLGIWVYYLLKPGSNVHPNSFILLAPVLLFIMAFLGLGFGLLISAMTNKYKDLVFLLTFAVQLAMYATPVIYPISSVPEKYQWLIKLNPMTAVVETFRYGFLGSGSFSIGNFLYSLGFSLVMLLMGTLVFNKVEKSFMDTV